MATSTYLTFLMKKASEGDTWEKLIDIKDYPDLGGQKELLDTTTLSNGMKVGIPGIQDMGMLEFTANYDLQEYEKLKALNVKEEEYAVWFGGTDNGVTVTPTGTEGKFSFTGTLDVYPVGAGTNAVRDMKINIAVSTDIRLQKA